MKIGTIPHNQSAAELIAEAAYVSAPIEAPGKQLPGGGLGRYCVQKADIGSHWKVMTRK